MSNSFGKAQEVADGPIRKLYTGAENFKVIAVNPTKEEIERFKKMRDLNLPLPSSLVLWSPWLDLAKVGDSHFTLADNDPSLKYSNLLENAALAYSPESEFKNPYVSPVYGDFSKKFPPTLIQVGSKEILLSDAIRMYRTLDDHDIETKLDVYEGMWHVWQGYYLTPESKTAVKNTNRFILKHLNMK